MVLIRNGIADNNTKADYPLFESFLTDSESTTVRISAEIDLQELEPHINRLSSVEIEFPSFTDGRGFSIARQLRKHMNYNGELIATGPLIPDQYSLFMQCGFDAVKIDSLTYLNQSESEWRTAVDTYHLSYQNGYETSNGSFQNIIASRNSKAPVSLYEKYKDLKPEAALERALKIDFQNEIVLATSFGADSAVLLHMISRIDKNTPIVFLETGKHFSATLAYRDLLVKELGLTNFQNISPDSLEVEKEDPNGTLYSTDKNACCDLRKVRPYDHYMKNYKAKITGRKRYQTLNRSNIEIYEEGDGRAKINPLAFWKIGDVERYISKYNLPPHPLVKYGFKSIACMTCTTQVKENEDPRAGRWRESSKNECGIH